MTDKTKGPGKQESNAVDLCTNNYAKLLHKDLIFPDGEYAEFFLCFVAKSPATQFKQGWDRTIQLAINVIYFSGYIYTSR